MKIINHFLRGINNVFKKIKGEISLLLNATLIDITITILIVFMLVGTGILVAGGRPCYTYEIESNENTYYTTSLYHIGDGCIEIYNGKTICGNYNYTKKPCEHE